MIVIKHMYAATPSMGVEITDKFKQAQFARQIEKYLMRRFSIICEVEVQ